MCCSANNLPTECCKSRNGHDRQMAMICGHQSKSLPSCAARQTAMICGQKSKNSPSCVARQMAMICGHQSEKSPSCVARQMAMICGHQSKSVPSCGARQIAMSCGEKGNIPVASEPNWRSCNDGHLIQSFDNNRSQPLDSTQFLFEQCDDQHLSNKIRPGFTLGDKINANFSSKSCTQRSRKASINDTLDCDYLASCASNIAETTRTENTHLAILHLDKALPVNKANKKRKRDREPSRISVNRVLRVLKTKKFRRKVKNFLRKSIPSNSFVNYLCGNYKYWHLWYNTEHYFGQHVFFPLKRKNKTNLKRHACNQTNLFLVARKPDFYQFSATSSTLKGGVLPNENFDSELPWSTLTDRLAQISLVPHDVGGSGDCFFKSVSHQLYETSQLHYEIRMSGIAHLNDHPELYIESISNNNWANYVQQMSNPGSWCDNIIVQAVANANNCIIHITESDVNKPQGTTITPKFQDNCSRVIFIGYINELHYVSTVPDKNSPNRTRLANFKRTLTQSTDQKRAQLAKRRNSTSVETIDERQKRLAKLHQNYNQRKAKETNQDKHKRLQELKKLYAKQRAVETDEDRHERLQKRRDNDAKRTAEESIDKKQGVKKMRKAYCTNHESVQNENSFEDNFDFSMIKEKQQQKNSDYFHESNKFSMKQCIVCQEVWPSKSNSSTHRTFDYKCLRCMRDKKQPQKFSKENNMVPSKAPYQLQDLTQLEEMLIARALPIMTVYIKPGGQRGYSGHCINLPQCVEELALSLPRYPKDLTMIVVKMKGKDNNFKNISVRRQKVADALRWLINNNPHYKDVKINQHSLNCLPDHGVPHDIVSVETEDDHTESCEPDLGPQNAEDIVYNEQTEMNSFLPIPQCEQQEIQAIQQQLSSTYNNQVMSWPTVDNDPINEYTTPFLATLAFPALFPDGKGDPTNPALNRDVQLAERIKHLLKYAEQKDGRWLYRFASHPRFAYWAFNMIERKRILQQTGIFLKQNPGEAHLTIEELQEMTANNSANVLLSKMSRYLANISGSNAYWFKARENLKAIISNVGPPTFFFTFSSADMHWPELHALFNSDGSNTPENRRQNVINNPHITDWFFTQRLENFIKYWLYHSLDAEWHWYRFEYQARGSIHCHGVAKLKNDPGLCKLSERALKGYLAEKSLDNAELTDLPKLNEQIRGGRKASEVICKYVDWLLSTYNPDPPDNGTWIKPTVHPCQQHHKDIQNSDSDYIDLLNTVQRHTRCSSNYCLRKKENESELKCRFHFPFQPAMTTKLQFEPINSKTTIS